MEKFIKKTKGITLIALVVTIVVLLILAGISLNMVLGENGLVTKAREARDKTKEAKENELADMDRFDQEIDDIVNSDKSTSKTLADALEDGDLQIGDYVDYKPTAGNSYTSEVDKNGWADQTYTVDTNTTWRVLGKDENGQVLLISGSPIKKVMDSTSSDEWDNDPYFYMKGAYAYEYCEDELNGICSIYSTDIGMARSMTIEDINAVCGIKVDNNWVYKESDPDTNIDAWGVMGYTYNYAASDYTPEGYINGKQNATEGDEVVSTGYYYYIDSLKDIEVGNTTLGSLLFDKTAYEDNYAKAYWLACPGVYAISSEACFGTGSVDDVAGPGDGSFYANGDWTAGRLGVRPIVTLRGDVTLDDVKIINGSVTEEDWSEYNTDWDASGDASNGEAGNHGN